MKASEWSSGLTVDESDLSYGIQELLFHFTNSLVPVPGTGVLCAIHLNCSAFLRGNMRSGVSSLEPFPYQFELVTDLFLNIEASGF